MILFCVKLCDAEQARRLLPPSSHTVVVDPERRLSWTCFRRVGPKGRGGAAYIMATLDGPGRIRHLGADTLVFGQRGGGRSPRLVGFEAAGQRAGFKATLSTSIEVDLWTKFVRLSTWSGMTTVSRSTVGMIRDDPALAAMMRAALFEAIAVGRARGVQLPAELPAETEALVSRFPHEAKSSMLEDLEHGRRLELPWLSGALVRMGREAGVPTPVHGFIAAALGPFVAGTPRVT